MAKKKGWVKPQLPPAKKIAECPDCGELINEGDAIWQMIDRFVCFDCHPVYHEMGIGYMDFAGLVLPGMALEI